MKRTTKIGSVQRTLDRQTDRQEERQTSDILQIELDSTSVQ